MQIIYKKSAILSDTLQPSPRPITNRGMPKVAIYNPQTGVFILNQFPKVTAKFKEKISTTLTVGDIKFDKKEYQPRQFVVKLTTEIPLSIHP